MDVVSKQLHRSTSAPVINLRVYKIVCKYICGDSGKGKLPDVKRKREPGLIWETPDIALAVNSLLRGIFKKSPHFKVSFSNFIGVYWVFFFVFFLFRIIFLFYCIQWLKWFESHTDRRFEWNFSVYMCVCVLPLMRSHITCCLVIDTYSFFCPSPCNPTPRCQYIDVFLF